MNAFADLEATVRRYIERQPEPTDDERAEALAGEMLDEIIGRRSFRREWGKVDADIQREIEQALIRIARRYIERQPARGGDAEAALFEKCPHCDGDGDEPNADNDVTGPPVCSMCLGEKYIRARRQVPEGHVVVPREQDGEE